MQLAKTRLFTSLTFTQIDFSLYKKKKYQNDIYFLLLNYSLIEILFKIFIENMQVLHKLVIVE